ncbi:MAG: thioesterase family protein [Actinomycetota bacterium]|nr:thioesterase family protein [Acidimicrobiia bacterium]MDQ3293499.1 thioesterase family protein [Actinomycetota bacterium]
MDIARVLALEPHGPDTFVGAGPRYEWGGLYGGQIVAQALRAAASTVADGFRPHSLRAYFIRPGDHAEPVRYEVDRPRDGRSFCTRRVIARQAVGAILNLEASFHVGESSAEVQTEVLEPVPDPGELEDTSSISLFERRKVAGTDPRGRVRAWFRMRTALGDDPLAQACSLAYMSDDLPTDAVMRAHPIGRLPQDEVFEHTFTASLDHTIWFHRPLRTEEWHLHDFSCHGFTAGRGLAIGQVFRPDGAHVATVAQEVLLRDKRK